MMKDCKHPETEKCEKCMDKSEGAPTAKEENDKKVDEKPESDMKKQEGYNPSSSAKGVHQPSTRSKNPGVSEMGQNLRELNETKGHIAAGKAPKGSAEQLPAYEAHKKGKMKRELNMVASQSKKIKPELGKTEPQMLKGMSFKDLQQLEKADKKAPEGREAKIKAALDKQSEAGSPYAQTRNPANAAPAPAKPAAPVKNHLRVMKSEKVMDLLKSMAPLPQSGMSMQDLKKAEDEYNTLKTRIEEVIATGDRVLIARTLDKIKGLTK